MNHYWPVMFVLSPDASLTVVALGIAAITLEFVRPGWVLPAVIGCLFVVFGIHSLAQYPLVTSGLFLIATGFSLCALEARFQTRGIMGLAAAAAFVSGSIRLVRGPSIHTSTALATGLLLAALLSILLSLAWRARRMKRSTIF